MYDFGTKRMFVDRTKSGNVGFDGTFANTYYAPLSPGSDLCASFLIPLRLNESLVAKAM